MDQRPLADGRRWAARTVETVPGRSRGALRGRPSRISQREPPHNNDDVALSESHYPSLERRARRHHGPRSQYVIVPKREEWTEVVGKAGTQSDAREVTAANDGPAWKHGSPERRRHPSLSHARRPRAPEKRAGTQSRREEKQVASENNRERGCRRNTASERAQGNEKSGPLRAMHALARPATPLRSAAGRAHLSPPRTVPRSARKRRDRWSSSAYGTEKPFA